MKTRVLITGAGGFVGANIVEYMTSSHEVHGLVRPGRSYWRLSKSTDVHVHAINMHNLSQMKRLMNRIRPQYVIHTASHGAYPTQKDEPSMIETNITATLTLLQSLQGIPYRQCIVTGSSSEYGKKDKPMRESDVCVPNNMYAATKLGQTAIACAYGIAHNVPVMVARLFNVYGPMEEKGRLVRNVIEAALAGSTINLSTGREARDFVYVGDVAAACAHICDRPEGISGQIYNIGTGRQTTTYQLARRVLSMTRSGATVRRGVYPGREWDAMTWKASTGKTTRELGWTASYTLGRGLKETIEWYKNNG